MFGKKFEKKQEEKKVREVSTFREYFELFAETLVYVFFVMTFLLQSFVIPTGSMQNNILIGDHLLVNKVAYSRFQGSIDDIIFPQKKISRGSIVTFKAPAEMDKEYVKRVIGLPGETIKVVNKKVYVDGNPLVEPYVHFDEANINGGYGDNFPLQQPRYIDVLGKVSFLPFYINDPNGFVDSKRTTAICDQFKDAVLDVNNEKVFKVPEGYYFCMGDNRDHSYDSRFWGPVPAGYIIGKPWRVYWSYESITEDYLTPGVQHKVKDIAMTVVNFFSKTRWERTIKKIE
ncbi:MAG TPA: signal peptidase I [Candidatus Deferrimicrobium sp.]|nr:signal peptidase I [Candidatus Deferrimicrobium sp.]